MDAEQQMVFDGECPAAVLGRGEEFILIFLDGPINDAATAEAAAKGFAYCGVMAVSNGQCCAKFDPTNPEGLDVMMRAAWDFAERVAGKIKRQRSSTDWLERLWNLPDTRN